MSRTLIPKHIREALRKAPPGWRYAGMSGRTHVQLLHDSGRMLTASYSPKNADHAIRNILRDIKRYTP